MLKVPQKDIKRGEIRTLEDGKGFVELDFDDIDFAEYAAGARRQDGTVVTKNNVTKEEVEEGKETITTLLTNQFTNKLDTGIRKIIITKDGRVFVDFSSNKDLRVPLKKRSCR